MEKKEHPQAKWLRAIADGETLQSPQPDGRWLDMSASYAMTVLTQIDRAFRVKPRTITIGKYEVAEPMLVAPPEGTLYWTLNQIAEGAACSYTWGGDGIDEAFRASGMCWLKREDAELAAKAITELLTGKT